ncbi:beta-ketoacyl synthase N-terminal-like domain-containing protein [Desulfosarcina sp.]|uniref:beta-ketoacyl synthase N-terminal-like domain-containing protein n=1 Tax=Desulfosarcina sp. TaxID=2027861 RepID=UPI00397050BA
MNPVAIAGVGCICALGATYDGCMQALYTGSRNFGLPSRFPSHCETSQPVFEVPDRFLDPWPFCPTLPRTCRMTLIAAQQAVAQAHLKPDSLARQRVGVCVGTNIGVTAGYEIGQTKTGSFLLPRDRFLATNPTSLVANTWDLSGPQQTVANACSAGSDAIGIAAAWIAAGYCDAVIAGGADELTPRVYYGFKSLFINDEHPCRPFDRYRKGLNLGEGASIFLLASPAFCRSWQIDPVGYILGYGGAADAHHFTQPRPDGQGLRLAIGEALATAGTPADQICFINAHGTGTLGNDRVESQIIADLFPGKPFLSTKGYTGHALGAAGPIEAALTLGCLTRAVLPATAGYETPDPQMPAHPVAIQTPVHGSVALTQTLAFGGSNSVLVLGSKGCLS